MREATDTRPDRAPDAKAEVRRWPTLWDRWSHRLEITSGELLPDQSVPLLKRRWELSREEALKLWAQKRQQGWQSTMAKYQPPQVPPS